ncbi:ATP-binding protein [Almyronema epifaneia]|uniref:ATP-binding protein n=1 Tax=Almyronema epifaneia S1 TaxID=2991925 RepID=A0ABW6IFI9_9CYAN
MTAALDWQTTNQQALAAALDGIRQQLRHYVASQGVAAAADREPLSALSQPSAPSTLSYLSAVFQLTPFEQQVLLLCAGVELSASLAQLCATAQGGDRFTYATFSLALAVFPAAHWSAIAPIAPLRRWRLIEVTESDSLTQSRLRIDERVLHYLAGVPYVDDRLQGLIRLVAPPDWLLPSRQPLVQRLVDVWRAQPSPLVQFCSQTAAEPQAIAAVACQTLEAHLYQIRAIDIPTAISEREALARLWEREALLSHSALFLDCEGLTPSALQQTVKPWLESLQARLAIASPAPILTGDRPLVYLEVSRSHWAEQRQIWQQTLSPLELNGQIDALVSQFNLSPATIESVWAEVSQQPLTSTAALATQLWDSCRLRSRPQLEHLAQRLTAVATWADLVLPERELQMLQEIAAQVRQQAKVYDTWAFSPPSASGLGISALFAGPSGTGKTLAAAVLAHELRLDLYRIDLSQVVSKYVGETEKNLRQVFDAAEAGGAILLFDEADALFGKRSEVKDAHDRYANIEVSYLLQRMEAYRGLAILTTNLKKSIDSAFLRRLRFLVQFPFPDVAQRLEIWRRIFPASLPTQALDYPKLARLNITGGNIRNVALNAAFLAADENVPLQMSHLLRAAKTEYTKLDKTLTDAEIGGWL